MPKNVPYGNMPKAKHNSVSSGDKSVVGGKVVGNASMVFKAGPDSGKGKSSAPFHYQSRPTGSKKFPGKKSRKM